ncbi:MAG: hypothetical protein JW860_14900 [Sedimentisphaerales bacterium]|nr:hypothetical protein [Sedimentisphaerales bacterium]
MNNKHTHYLILIALVLYIPAQAQTAVSEDTPAGKTDISPVQEYQSPILLNEGFRIIDRRAKLIRHPEDNRWFLAFEPIEPTDKTKEQAPKTPHITTSAFMTESPDEPPKPQLPEDESYSWLIEILPGKWLTVMTKITANKENLKLTFRIWGEITTYRKRNFILPTMVATESLFGKKAGQLTKTSKASDALALVLGTDSSQANEQPETPQVNLEELARDLRRKLLTIPRTHLINLPEEQEDQTTTNTQSSNQTSATRSTGLDGPSKITWKDGQMVIDREGRLMYSSQEDRFMFIFEADSPSLQEPPVLLHPNQLLQKMEEMAGVQILRRVKFRITGQITTYQSKNYMLLNKVLLNYNSNNLGK